MKQLIHFFSLVNFALCKGGRGGGSFGGGTSTGGGPGGDVSLGFMGYILFFLFVILFVLLIACLQKIDAILEERKNKAERERALRE